MSNPITFATEQERLKAREQYATIRRAIDDRFRTFYTMGVAEDEFDATFPPVVEAPAPKCDDDIHDEMCDCKDTPSPAFEAALDALLLAYIRAANVLGQATALRDPLVRERVGAYDAARAEVVRIHREEVERGK